MGLGPSHLEKWRWREELQCRLVWTTCSRIQSILFTTFRNVLLISSQFQHFHVSFVVVLGLRRGVMQARREKLPARVSV